MTVQQTVKALQVSRMTVLRMMKAGKLTNVAPILPLRTRQPILFDKSQVDQYLPHPRPTTD